MTSSNIPLTPRLDRTVHALRGMQVIAVREIKSRFTGDRFGYLWVYATPLAWVGVVYAVFYFFGSRVPINTDILSFILSGIIPYASFRYVINGLIRARNTYRQVVAMGAIGKPLVLTAVGLVESYNGLIVGISLLLFNYLAFGYFEMADPLMALWGYSLAAGLGAAFGYLMVALGNYSEAFPRSNQVVLRPMFYVSGIFYIANELPLQLMQILSWNPLFHAIELLREGMFEGYRSVMADSMVPLAWIAVMGALAWAFGSRRFGAAGDGAGDAEDEA